MTNDGRPFQREIETILIQYQSRGLLRALTRLFVSWVSARGGR